MFSNDTTQIRAGFVNYMGALLSASKLPPKAARHDVSAILIEEAVGLAKNDDTYDMYILKPLLRANKHVFLSHIKEIEKSLEEVPKELRNEMESKKADYQNIINSIDKILNGFEGEKNG